MAKTRTGNFPIGFRRRNGEWEQSLDNVIRFALDNGFEALDLPALPAEDVQQVLDAGLHVGTVDLPQPWTGLICADEDRRNNAADRCAAYMKEILDLGVHHFFVVLLPDDPSLPRRDNMSHAVSACRRLCDKLEGTAARILIEGYPGGGPHYAALGCTPADFRLFRDQVGSDCIGVNFDPSHLVRMAIDPLQFAREFASQIHHVHAKDTEIRDEELYEHGNLQPATEAAKHRFGAHHWRYTIPGHGIIRWGRLLELLVEIGYQGSVCIELEDENFNGAAESEQRGLIAARDFMAHV